MWSRCIKVLNIVVILETPTVFGSSQFVDGGQGRVARSLQHSIDMTSIYFVYY
jgi:hypothetical protein